MARSASGGNRREESAGASISRWAAAACAAGVGALPGALACPPPGPRCAVCDWDSDGDSDCLDAALYIADYNALLLCADIDDGSGTGTPDGAVDVFDFVYFASCYLAPPASCQAAPGESCSAPINLGVGSAVVPFDVCAARTNPEGQMPGGGVEVSQDTWYCWTAPCTGTVRIQSNGFTLGAYADTKTAVYVANPACGQLCPADSSIALVIDPDPDPAVSPFADPGTNMEVPVVAGQTYLIQHGLSPRVPFPAPGAGTLFLVSRSTCAFDTNENCIFDCDDIAGFWAAWEAASLKADFDNFLQTGTRDGIVSLVDLLYFLTNYNAAPPNCNPLSLATANTNDTCANAMQISPGPALIGLDTTCATQSGPDHPRCHFSPSIPPGAIERDLWYTFTAPSNGTATIMAVPHAAFPMGWDIRFTVYVRAGCAALGSRVVACSDDFGNPQPSQSPFEATLDVEVRANETYMVRVGSGGAAAFGPGVLRILFAPTPICPPASPVQQPFRQYKVAGIGNGTAFSWCVHAEQTSLCEYNEIGFVGGNPGLRDHLVARINASAAVAGCAGRVVAAASPTSPSAFRITLNGYDAPQLWVGGVGAYPNCLVVPALTTSPSGSACVFNPTIVEHGPAGQDCNANGVDDRDDVFFGASRDNNQNGIPDECDPCVADLDDGSGSGVPDGTVDIADLLLFLAWFDQGDLGADVDDGSSTNTVDEAVDIADLLYFLVRFGAGC